MRNMEKLRAEIILRQDAELEYKDSMEWSSNQDE
jgi:hypothetical protein